MTPSGLMGIGENIWVELSEEERKSYFEENCRRKIKKQKEYNNKNKPKWQRKKRY